MSNKVFRLTLIICFSFFILECSLDNKTGIWNDKPKQKKVDIKLIKLSNQENELQKEINPSLKISLSSKTKKNIP